LQGAVCDKSQLQPPAYFDRRVRAPVPSLLPLSCSQRPPSCNNLQDLSKDGIFRTKGMAQSMPNLHSSRSVHNCYIGCTILSNPSECGATQERQKSRARVQEFEDFAKWHLKTKKIFVSIVEKKMCRKIQPYCVHGLAHETKSLKRLAFSSHLI
jgi:hypothetical protein